MKVVNRADRWIGYRLNILGIRVFDTSCQLSARSGEKWGVLGPPRELPVHVPRTADELMDAASDPLRLTAFQYISENRASDLAKVLSQEKGLDQAMEDANGMTA